MDVLREALDLTPGAARGVEIVKNETKMLHGQPGADFLKAMPTVWDDTKVLAGYPGEYIAIAKQSPMIRSLLLAAIIPVSELFRFQ